MTKNKKGFTIIEVVLVLAIAGLIFLMVFIALPALQRSQRNTQREDDLARVLTAVNDYQSNNNGKTPFDPKITATDKLEKFVKRYLDSGCEKGAHPDSTVAAKFSGDGVFSSCGGQFSDPQGDPYVMSNKGKAAGSATDVSSDQYEKVFNGYYHASCGDEGYTNPGTGDRDVAVYLKLEGGAIACNDNH